MSAFDAEAESRAGSVRPSLVRAQRLLEEALQLIDEHGAHPELGARLQEVIEGLESSTD
jgi:hypothetical protein